MTIAGLPNPSHPCGHDLLQWFPSDGVHLPATADQIAWATLYKTRVLTFLSTTPNTPYNRVHDIIHEAIRFENDIRAVPPFEPGDKSTEEEQDVADVVTLPPGAPAWAYALAHGINKMNRNITAEVMDLGEKLDSVEEKLEALDEKMEDITDGVNYIETELGEAFDAERFEDAVRRQVALMRNMAVTGQGGSSLVPVPNDDGNHHPSNEKDITSKAHIDALSSDQVTKWLRHYGVRISSSDTLEKSKRELRVQLGCF
ncbi:hypothetical protein D9615_000968 [Tricholomella constricta]|uniref:Mug135-like C-terminal domain-containing protein n=1 Tax=Tricholomella constricta TaxID=117010 RepID=A0A8H5M8J3_9AGAR|nr:hypothetical protein D9615_000968 [Tricholomella constricta]